MTGTYLMSLLMLLWILTKDQYYSLPLREAEDEEAGDGVAEEGGEVGYLLIFHRCGVRTEAQRYTMVNTCSNGLFKYSCDSECLSGRLYYV